MRAASSDTASSRQLARSAKSRLNYTRAKLFQTAGKKTPLAIRFSTVIGGRDSSETARDPRGFAVKFYTEDGKLGSGGQ